MPFLRIVPEQRFTREVSIHVLGAEKPALLNVEYRSLPRKRMQALLMLSGMAGGRIRRITEHLKLCWRKRKLATLVDMLDEIIVGWSGAIDAEYSPANLRALLVEYPGAGMSLFTGFLKGYDEERRKN